MNNLQFCVQTNFISKSVCVYILPKWFRGAGEWLSLKQEGGGAFSPKTEGEGLMWRILYTPLKLDTAFNSPGIKGLKSKDSIQ